MSSNPQSTIRPFHQNDLESCVLVWQNASSLAHEFLSHAFLEKETIHMRQLYFNITQSWVVEINGNVVGFISMLNNEIGGLFVEPTYHGQGLGFKLVEHVKLLHDHLEVEVFE